MQYSSHFIFVCRLTCRVLWPDTLCLASLHLWFWIYLKRFFLVIYVNCSHFVIVLCIYAHLTRVWDSLLWWGEIYGSVDCSEVSVFSSVEHSVKSINANVLCWNILNIIDDWFLPYLCFAWYILASLFVYLFARYLLGSSCVWLRRMNASRRCSVCQLNF